MALLADAKSCPITDPRPPRVRSPKLIQGIEFAFFRRSAMRKWIGRYGRVFEINVPLFGRSVVVSDPSAVRVVCSADPNHLGNVTPNLGNWFGTGSVFGLDGSRHQARRRLLAPAFHGRPLRSYEHIIEDETLRETAKWRDDHEFPALETMNRITLNVILRVIFGTGRPEVEPLRVLIPRYLRLGQVLAFIPAPPAPWRRIGPWAALGRLRSTFDRLADKAIEQALADPCLDGRTDLLAFLVRSMRDDPAGIPREDIGDELLTLVCAGHETTASALTWTFERLRRQPELLAELVAETDRGGGALRAATVAESLRVRTIIDVFGRRVRSAPLDLCGLRIPAGRNVLVRITDVHDDPAQHADPERFDPHRFLDSRPATPSWLPFGGGARRCIGADFAIAEMDAVLRIMFRDFTIRTDEAPEEKSRFRGIAHVPSRGGRIAVTRRR